MEYKLIQKDRYVYVHPTPPDNLTRILFNACSYHRKNARFMPNPSWGFIKLYDKHKARAPIGLLNTIQRAIEEDGHTTKLYLKLNRLRFYRREGLRPYQIIANETLAAHNGGIIQIPTGGGKTIMCLKLLQSNPGLKKLVLVPTINLRVQWQEQVEQDTVVRTYQSIKSKSFIKSFDIIVFDECHHVAARTLYLIGMNLKESANVIGLSATPTMRDDDNLKVFAVLGNIIYQITTKILMDAGYLCRARVVRVADCSIGDADEYFKTYQEVYDYQVVFNHKRNQKIVNIARAETGRVLILVNRIEHGSILFGMLQGDNAVFLNSTSSVVERCGSSARIIIATQIFDEGVDMPELSVLIVAGGGRSRIKTIQRAGRLLRPLPGKVALIYDFVDDSKWLSSHSEERFRVYEEEVVND